MVKVPELKISQVWLGGTDQLLRMQSAVMLKRVIVEAEVNSARNAGRPQGAMTVGLVDRGGAVGTGVWLWTGSARKRIRNKKQRRTFLIRRCGGGGGDMDVHFDMILAKNLINKTSLYETAAFVK